MELTIIAPTAGTVGEVLRQRGRAASRAARP